MLLSRFVAAGSGLLLSLGLGGCHPAAVSPASLVSQNDFESLAGWVPVPASVSSEQAHSGRFATKVDQGLEFGLGYASSLAEAGLRAGQRLTVRGWVLRTGGGSTASLVVQVLNPADPTQQVFWQAFPVEKQALTYNRWMPFKATVTLPAGCAPTHQLKAYLWGNESKQPTYLDDIVLVRE